MKSKDGTLPFGIFKVSQCYAPMANPVFDDEFGWISEDDALKLKSLRDKGYKLTQISYLEEMSNICVFW